MNLVPIVLTGGTVGAGVALLVREVLMRPQPALAQALRRTAPSSLPAAAEEGLDRDEVWGRWLLARLERLYAPSSAKTGSDEDVEDWGDRSPASPLSRPPARGLDGLGVAVLAQRGPSPRTVLVGRPTAGRARADAQLGSGQRSPSSSDSARAVCR